MKQSLSLPALLTVLLACAVLVDATVLPVLMNGRPATHMALALAIVVGLRRGPLWGLGAGWTAAVLRASLSLEPLGLAMLVFGLAGLAAGLLRKASALRVHLIDTLLALGLLALAEILASAIAMLAYGAPARFGIVSVLATAAVAAAGLAMWPPEESERPPTGRRSPA